jgi:predicted ABC-type ATPase
MKNSSNLFLFAAKKAVIQAGKVMLQRMHYLAEQKENFAFETTLACRLFVSWINQ